jgi:hypothetical protein
VAPLGGWMNVDEEVFSRRAPRPLPELRITPRV